jgi:ABC-type dipeptide/oligopeptide/nickel transport system ATPase component
VSVLEIEDLRTFIRLRSGVVRAVDGVSFAVEPGETVGLVGESGCGKTMTGLSIMGLLPNGGFIAGGAIRLGDTNLAGLGEPGMRQVRGNQIGMVFQDPMTSLNPTMTIGNQVAEVVRRHRGVSKPEAIARAEEVLALVGMPRPAERLSYYPHQLSGGLRQRVMIGIALACEPRLLIADEPTTALDVTIQDQILALLDELKERLGMAVLLITHDLGVIAGRADRVLVMYAGKIVEKLRPVICSVAPAIPTLRHCWPRSLGWTSRHRGSCTPSPASRPTSSARRPDAGSRHVAGSPPMSAGTTSRCSAGRTAATPTPASTRPGRALSWHSRRSCRAVTGQRARALTTICSS